MLLVLVVKTVSYPGPRFKSPPFSHTQEPPDLSSFVSKKKSEKKLKVKHKSSWKYNLLESFQEKVLALSLDTLP